MEIRTPAEAERHFTALASAMTAPRLGGIPAAEVVSAAAVPVRSAA